MLAGSDQPQGCRWCLDRHDLGWVRRGGV